MNIIDRSLCGLPLPQREHLIRQDERARRAGLPCHGKTSERGEQGYLVTARRASAASRATLSRQDERARRAGLPCHGKTSERGEQGYLVTARRASAASRATDLTEHARSASGSPPSPPTAGAGMRVRVCDRTSERGEQGYNS